MSRIAKLTFSLQSRQSRRLDLALFRSGFVLATLVLTISLRNAMSAGFTITAAKCLVWFYPMSLIFVGVLAGRVNRGSSGDASSGFLTLVALTGTSRSEWCLCRIAETWIGFLSVWIVRIPILLLMFTFGGLRWSNILCAEILFLFVFAAVNAKLMVLSHSSGSKTIAAFTGIGTITVIELALHSGRIASSVLKLLSISPPNWVDTVADFMSRVSLVSTYQQLIAGSSIFDTLVYTLLVYLGLGIFWTMRFGQNVFDSIGKDPEQGLADRKELNQLKRRLNPLPRCWDDALAWQGYVYYAGGNDNTTGRVVLYGLGYIALLSCIWVGGLEVLTGIILVIGAIVMINSINSPAQFLDKEIKTKTLSTLVMTPHSGQDFYTGWRRGTLWLTIPDHLFAAITALTMYFVEPIIAYVIICFVALVNCCGPFFMLSALVPLRFYSLVSALAVVMGLVVVIAIGAIVAVNTNALMFLIVTLPLMAGFNFLLKKIGINYWMGRKIDQEI